ncbi:hypothetical protein MPH_07255 [Macrophomina phaseolina MS6]|uniref:Uncharacterized protein n=1 Tax=Macrophomina phaseolina (strain MS6) TaxID=1126212 RepID=K2SFD8_MACPH|nr:hypothetical protein MPH_07255 [Macrophomina phaseolina MS6]
MMLPTPSVLRSARSEEWSIWSKAQSTRRNRKPSSGPRISPSKERQKLVLYLKQSRLPRLTHFPFPTDCSQSCRRARYRTAAGGLGRKGRRRRGRGGDGERLQREDLRRGLCRSIHLQAQYLDKPRDWHRRVDPLRDRCQLACRRLLRPGLRRWRVSGRHADSAEGSATRRIHA